MKRFFRFIFRTCLWFVVLTVAWVLTYRFLPVPYTPLMAIRNFNEGEAHQKKHEWIDLEQISPSIQLAVICSEDQRFLLHDGFDYESIQKALDGNKEGNQLRGASTISQQTAKNVFLWPKRNYFRKGMEVYFTFLIETLWSKERILEVYLNSIEMGDGVYGIEAASKHWFNKNAKNLTRHESAAIAAILPNPRKYRANPRTAYLESRKQWILRQMNNYGTLALKGPMANE